MKIRIDESSAAYPTGMATGCRVQFREESAAVGYLFEQRRVNLCQSVGSFGYFDEVRDEERRSCLYSRPYRANSRRSSRLHSRLLHAGINVVLLDSGLGPWEQLDTAGSLEAFGHRPNRPDGFGPTSIKISTVGEARHAVQPAMPPEISAAQPEEHADDWGWNALQWRMDEAAREFSGQ